MTTNEARRWVVGASFIVATSVCVFFLLAPLFKYPLKWPDALRMMEIVFPMFVGYLAAATQFMVQHGVGAEDDVHLRGDPKLVAMLLKGPFVVLALAFVVLAVAFGVSNSSVKNDGYGLGPDDFGRVLSLVLALLAATTNIIVGYLFAVRKRD
jgi:hypothetical protein